MGRIARTMSALLAEVEARLAPLSVSRNLAWWESQVAATDENEKRRTQAELAWSDALADGELFAHVTRERGREGAAEVEARQLELLRNLMLAQQVPAGLRERIVGLESSVDVRFSRHRGVVRGAEVDDIELKRILRQSEDAAERQEAWEASKTVEPRSQATFVSSRASGTRRPVARIPGLVRARRSPRTRSTRRSCRRHCARRTSRRPSPSRAGRDARRPACPPVRVRRLRASPVALRRPLLPGAAAGRGRRSRRAVRRTGHRRALPADVRGNRARGRRHHRAQRPVPARRKVPARVLYRRRPRGGRRVPRTSSPTTESAETMLHELGHGVYDLGLARSSRGSSAPPTWSRRRRRPSSSARSRAGASGWNPSSG